MERTQFGVMLFGDSFDLDCWMEAFALPFDPYAEKQEDLYILRSNTFDKYENVRDLDAEAKGWVSRLSGLMTVTHNALPVRALSVVEIGPSGITKQYVFAQMTLSEGRDKARADLDAICPDCAPLPPPQPSIGQRWIALAEGNDDLGDLLVYHSRGADWFDMYKSIECMERVFGGEKELAAATGFSVSRIKLLKRTANLARHARGKFDEPEKPMEQADAFELVGRMIRSVFSALESGAARAS